MRIYQRVFPWSAALEKALLLLLAEFKLFLPLKVDEARSAPLSELLDGLADEALSELSEALDAMSNQLDRPAPVKPMANAGQATMAQDERAADGADEAAASSDESLQKSGGTEEASGY